MPECPHPEPEPVPERTPLELCNDERDELFCTYLWDGGTETVWSQGDDGALVQVEREIVPDITRILDETDPKVHNAYHCALLAPAFSPGCSCDIPGRLRFAHMFRAPSGASDRCSTHLFHAQSFHHAQVTSSWLWADSWHASQVSLLTMLCWTSAVAMAVRCSL